MKECIAAQVIYFVKRKCFHFFCFFRTETFTAKKLFLLKIKYGHPRSVQRVYHQANDDHCDPAHGNEKRCYNCQKHTANIGYLPEERGLYKKMKVGEQALYLCQLKGLSKTEALKRLKYWFEKFEIESWWDKKVEELSKGMAQKVQFITTVLHEPELLIFDEPFSGFDPINAELLKKEIIELKNKGATVIFSTHNMDSVERLCENIALINKSQVVLSGNINQIRKQFSSHKYIVTLKDYNPLLHNDFHCANLLNLKQENNITHAEFTLKDNTTSNDLLSELIQKSTILKFEEQLPSMNDIFLKTVNK